ncbi:hypothetical protein [Microvirga rosea]|uniref:hypothetical protein n=1 Tax=Microvirga rosea TaxID=2715425 RepID=UPI001D0A9D7C|nr:hypothetical protein [Microvirga rosea]MCB8820999.1 hypothetical protein [Microvirga rosea]
MAGAKTRTASKESATDADPGPQQRPQSLRIIDTPGITEQFANQVLDVFLVNGHTISMTFGAKRTVREETLGERETVIAVNARLTIDLAAAEALRSALTKVIALTKPPSGGVN